MKNMYEGYVAEEYSGLIWTISIESWKGDDKVEVEVNTKVKGIFSPAK